MITVAYCTALADNWCTDRTNWSVADTDEQDSLPGSLVNQLKVLKNISNRNIQNFWNLRKTHFLRVPSENEKTARIAAIIFFSEASFLPPYLLKSWKMRGERKLINFISPFGSKQTQRSKTHKSKTKKIKTDKQCNNYRHAAKLACNKWHKL